MIALPLVDCVNESHFLTVHLFEVGGLWINATLELGQSIMTSLLVLPDMTSLWTYLIGAVVIYAAYHLYRLFFVPINRVRMLGDVGYVPEGTLSMKDMVNVVRKRRMIGEIPPIYPNGWFVVIESRDLKVAEVKNVSCLG